MNIARMKLHGLIMTALCLLLLSGFGCREAKQAAPEHPPKKNPYQTRLFIDGEETKDPRIEDLYPAGEKPIVKIIKGSAVDPGEKERLLSRSQEAPPALQGMSRMIRSLILKEVPVRQVTEILTRLCGYNVVPTRGIEDRKISIYMQEITLREALETICRLNNLWYREGNRIVTLMTREEYIDDIEIRQSEHTRAFSIKYTNAADMAKVIQAIMGSEVYLAEIEDEKVYGHVDPEEKADLPGDFKGPELDNSSQRIVFMNQIEKSRVQDSPAAVSTAPAASQAPDPGASRSSGATLNGTGRDGKKPLLAILTVFKRNNSIIARSLDGKLLNEMARIIEVMDTPTSQVLLEVKILQISLGDEFESFFQMEFGDYDGETVTSRIDPTQTLYKGFGLNTLASATASGSTFGGTLALGSIQARLSFFQEEGRVNSISSPFLMCANNSTVNFFVGEEVPLRDDVSKETIPIGDSGNTINTFIVDIQREELGTDVEMSTFINEDDTVTMEIKAEISSPQYAMTTIGLTDDLGNIINFPLDGQSTSEIESILTARSGQTVALGGIIRENMDHSIKKVPVLGDMPVLKYLFSQENDTRTKTETIILLTPHIIRHPGLSAKQTDQFLDRKSSHQTILKKRENLLDSEAEK